MRRKYQYLAAAMAIAAPVTAQAQTASVGLDGLVGIVRDDSTATGTDDDVAIVALPSASYGETFVVQVDGLIAGHRDDTVFGGALRIGTRVGDGAYVGAYGSRSENDRHTGLALYRLGGEVEFDLGDMVEISAVAGYEDTESGAFLTGTTATDDIYDVYDGDGRFFAFSDLRFRTSENFRVSVGHRYTGGLHAAAAGVVFGVTRSLAVFAEGRIGEEDYDGGFVGLRARFGGGNNGASLLDNRMLEDLFAPSNTRSTLAVPLPPPAEEEEEDGGGCGSCGGYGGCSA